MDDPKARARTIESLLETCGIPMENRNTAAELVADYMAYHARPLLVRATRAEESLAAAEERERGLRAILREEREAHADLDAHVKGCEQCREAIERPMCHDGRLRLRRVEQAMQARADALDALSAASPTPTVDAAPCVYCGHAYPPGTPAYGSDVLTAHVNVCEKHPLAGLRRSVRETVEFHLGDDGACGDETRAACLRSLGAALLALCDPPTLNKSEAF